MLAESSKDTPNSTNQEQRWQTKPAGTPAPVGRSLSHGCGSSLAFARRFSILLLITFCGNYWPRPVGYGFAFFKGDSWWVPKMAKKKGSKCENVVHEGELHKLNTIAMFISA